MIAAAVGDVAVVNPNDMKTLLASGVSKSFINGKRTFIKGPSKLSNLPSWLIIFILVPFNKIPLFSKELVTFIIPFISLFARVISEPKNYLLSPSIPLFTNCLVHFFFFDTPLANVDSLGFTIFNSILKAETIKVKGKIHPNCTTLDSWVFKDFMLAGESFVKVL